MTEGPYSPPVAITPSASTPVGDVVTAAQVDESAWSILLTVKESLTKEQRATIFTAICEATLPLEDALGVEIDVSGQPLHELVRPFDRSLEAALSRAETGGWFTLTETMTVGGLAQFVTMLLEHPDALAAGGAPLHEPSQASTGVDAPPEERASDDPAHSVSP